MYIYGKYPVIEAIKSGKNSIEKVFLSFEGNFEIQKLCKEKGINYQFIDKRKLDKLTNGKNHQNVVAQISVIEYSELDDVIKDKEGNIILILDGINDTHNIGAIIRTAEACGVDGIILPKKGSAPINETVNKTSAGAINYIKIVRRSNLGYTIDELKNKNFWIVGLDVKGNKDYSEINYPEKIVIVIGNENKGIRKILKEKCDYLVKIPMMGKIESLNVSVATGIILYEILRQNRIKGKSKGFN